MEQITSSLDPSRAPQSVTHVFLSTLIPAPHWRAAAVSQFRVRRELDLVPEQRLESSEAYFIFNSFQKNVVLRKIAKLQKKQ